MGNKRARGFFHYVFLAFAFILTIMPCACLQAEPPLLWGFAIDGHPVTDQKLTSVETETMLRPDIVVFFLQWPSPADASSQNFPLESLEAIWNRGALPCITWEPMYHKDGKETMISHSQLLGGHYDQYITRFAEKAKLWNKPFMIRFGHEMNIKRYHWGTQEDGYGPQSPAIYRQMFRYVVELFRKTGAHNVLWVFCPNVESLPNTSYDPSASWNTLSNYYPGDDYVDILGLDGYNWGNTQTKDKNGWESSWKSFREIFAPACGELMKLGHERPGKPVIVFETACVGHGGNKMEWIRDALSVSRQLGIQGIVWFQSKKELDWRIDSDTDRGYVSLIKSEASFSRSWVKRILWQKAR